MDTKKDKANAGILFSTLLSYYCSKKEINLATLLTFPLWPEYLKHYSKLLCSDVHSINSKVHKDFSVFVSITCI